MHITYKASNGLIALLTIDEPVPKRGLQARACSGHHSAARQRMAASAFPHSKASFGRLYVPVYDLVQVAWEIVNSL